MTMRRGSLLVALAVVVAACTPPSTAPAPLDKVTFMAGFKAQANLPFVAVYVAQERGYFRDQGLEVNIQHSAGQGEHIRLLATGRVQFTTASAGDALKRVANAEIPLVAIAQIGQRGEQAFAVRADSPIRTPRDWEGRLVGYKSTVSADYLAILRAAGVDRSKVREVPVGFDPRVLIEGRVDVYPVFVSNEPDTLARLGFPVRLFLPMDYGVPSLGLAFVTDRPTVEGRPDVVRRFLRAALRGLADAVEDREAAIDMTMRYAVGEDRQHQRAMLDAEIDGAITELTRREGLGAMTRQQWEDLQKLLVDLGAQPKAVDLGQIVDERFVREAYRNGRLIWP